MIKRPALLLVSLLLIAALLSACQGSGSAGTVPTQIPTAVPLAEVASTATAVTLPPPATPTTPPTITAAPTGTPPPSPTFAPSPTRTLAPSPIPSPTIDRATSPQTIGFSSQGWPLISYRLGNGPTPVIIVGGIHGGYEWNAILLAYGLLDHFEANPDLLPPTVTLHILPSANPDGLARVTGGKTGRFTPIDIQGDTTIGRFNSNDVDLNRNWDCQWQPTAQWRDRQVSGGAFPFSEAENVHLRDFLLELDPAVVVFLHSAANGVFAAGCPDTHQPSMDLATLYGRAAGYPIYERFTAYPITGDAGDWLATQDIATFTVELRNHQDLDWNANLAGTLALLNHFSQP